MATIKCKRCGSYYDSSTVHKCPIIGEDLHKQYFGSQETVKKSGDGSN